MCHKTRTLRDLEEVGIVKRVNTQRQEILIGLELWISFNIHVKTAQK